MPSINDPRERMANQLVMRGHASVDEILEASFGEWPPEGLDITGKNDQRVHLTSLIDMRKRDSGSQNLIQKIYGHFMDQTTAAGRATLVDARRIGINKLLCCTLPGLFGRSALNSTLGHETVHILQGDHYWRAKEVLGHEASQSIWRGQTNATSNLIAEKVFAAHEDRGFLKKAFMKVSGYVINDYNYLKEGLEIQARVHEVMQAGYPHWGRLPQNREELIVAMQDAGLNVPQAVQDTLESSPTIAATRAVFATGKTPGGTAVTDLNHLQRALTEDGKTALTGDALPFIYADLIEMYGDRLGRERFGLGVNPKQVFRDNDAARQVSAPATMV